MDWCLRRSRIDFAACGHIRSIRCGYPSVDGCAMMRFTIDTFYCFDGQTEEDIQVTFDYIKGFRGDITDPPHGDEIDIMGVRRNDYPTEEVSDVEWYEVCDDERINLECIQYAREEIMDAAEARRNAREGR